MVGCVVICPPAAALSMPPSLDSIFASCPLEESLSFCSSSGQSSESLLAILRFQDHNNPIKCSHCHSTHTCVSTCCSLGSGVSVLCRGAPLVVPGVSILDWPALEFRGIQLDCSEVLLHCTALYNLLRCTVLLALYSARWYCLLGLCAPITPEY